jgi:hypothetical protein
MPPVEDICVSLVEVKLRATRNVLNNTVALQNEHLTSYRVSNSMRKQQ